MKKVNPNLNVSGGYKELKQETFKFVQPLNLLSNNKQQLYKFINLEFDIKN